MDKVAPDASGRPGPRVADASAEGSPDAPCHDLLRTVIDHVPAFLALTDADGRYVIANRMYTQAFGVRPDELEGRLWHEVFPDLIAVHKPLIDRAMAGETVVFDDVLAVDPARPTHVHGHYRPLFDASGKVRFMSVVAMDITGRVEAETALRASEERFRLVNQAMDEAIGIRDGTTFRVYFMNPAYERLYGVPLEDLQNDPLATVRAVHPEDREAFVRWLQERRETRAGGEIEYRVVLPNGEVRWLWASGQPVLADDGSVRLWISASRDVTARRRAEAALAAETELLSAALRGIADGVIATDRQGRIELMNPVAESTTGWDRQEAMGQPLDAVFRVADVPAGAGADAAGAGHRTLLPRMGGPVPVAIRRTPMRDPDGDPFGEVVVFRDVADELRREEELIKSQKLESLAVLAGGIAHDFNNLLTGIQGNLSLALCGDALPEGLRGWLSDAQAAGDRARGLTQQLLTFARGGEPVRRPTDLGRAIRQAAAFSRVGSSVSCRVDVADGLWTVDADEGQIGQVVQNLVLNAIEATSGPGEVAVEAANVLLDEGNSVGLPRGPYVRIRVADHGVGIPDEIAGRIFDPYFSTKQRRSGLGLAITHSIVARHGGRIELRSVRGQGTRIDVLLPALPGACVEADGGREPGAGRFQRVLVMDDDPFVRRTVERLLGALGCPAVAASEGDEAVALFVQAREQGRPFDLLLLDLTVPGGTGGVETLAAIRQVAPDVPAVVMSGYADNPVMARHRDHGFQAVLPKPFTMDRLADAMREAASGDA